MKNIDWTYITPENAEQETLFCVKDTKSAGFQCKKAWYEKTYDQGLRMIMAKRHGKPLAFIEVVPAKNAWRPVVADDYLFIHCMYVYAKKDRSSGLGSALLKQAENEAKQQDLSGLCVMASKGAWIADSSLFKKNGFEVTDQRGRFELLAKHWGKKGKVPALKDWELELPGYQGWNLIYADQCPWHEKSVHALQSTAADHGIDLNVVKLSTPEEAQHAPSGFGVFALVRDGKLLEDHYISETRFKNMLKAEGK